RSASVGRTAHGVSRRHAAVRSVARESAIRGGARSSRVSTARTTPSSITGSRSRAGPNDGGDGGGPGIRSAPGGEARAASSRHLAASMPFTNNQSVVPTSASPAAGSATYKEVAASGGHKEKIHAPPATRKKTPNARGMNRDRRIRYPSSRLNP